MRTGRSLIFVILANGMSIGALIFFFNTLPIPTLIPCIYPLSQRLAFALSTSLFIHVFMINRIWLMRPKPIILIYLFLVVLILWLGSYPFSPLGFSTGHIPVVRGFIMTRFGRPALSIASGGILTMSGDSITEIKPITLPVDMTCIWVSTNGGALDDPKSCDTAYLSPGGVAYDRLKLLVQPACHLPNAHGVIRISIQP
jgi:hypothetical protein